MKYHIGGRQLVHWADGLWALLIGNQKRIRSSFGPHCICQQVSTASYLDSTDCTEDRSCSCCFHIINFIKTAGSTWWCLLLSGRVCRTRRLCSTAACALLVLWKHMLISWCVVPSHSHTKGDSMLLVPHPGWTDGFQPIEPQSIFCQPRFWTCYIFNSCRGIRSIIIIMSNIDPQPTFLLPWLQV